MSRMTWASPFKCGGSSRPEETGAVPGCGADQRSGFQGHERASGACARVPVEEEPEVRQEELLKRKGRSRGRR
jgi:hypothetical protein